jgi:hypothetical protein
MMQLGGLSGRFAMLNVIVCGSEFRHIPRRVSGSEETIVPAGGDDRIDILAWVTVALNIDLEGATTELDRYHEDCRLLRLGLPI